MAKTEIKTNIPPANFLQRYFNIGDNIIKIIRSRKNQN